MVRGLFVLLVCQLVGQFLVTLTGVPVPGPVVGLVLLLVVLKVRRPSGRSSVVRAADGLLDHLQLLFVPAGVGVIAYLPLIARSWLPIIGGLVIAWLAVLVVTAATGAGTLRLQDRLTRRSLQRAKADGVLP
jgi:holin-like protein